MTYINSEKLYHSQLTDLTKFLKLNFDQPNTSDTLNVNDFFLNDVERYVKNNLTTIWHMTYEEKIIALFTLNEYDIF